jgi:dethiobiotin synthetase
VDAVRLQRQSSLPLTYELVNPYAFAPAIAPHLAAAEVGVRIDLAHIKNCYAALAAKADAVVVEGVGGLLVPLSEQFTLADLVKALDLPVVLVVGLRLGCLNHALLTAEAIERRGLRFTGWVANGLEPEMDGLAENVLALTRRLPAPFLGLMPYHAKQSPSGAAFGLDVDAVARI